MSSRSSFRLSLPSFYFCKSKALFYTFFFFQAEDGIRDGRVTGVQTCALPICRHRRGEVVGVVALVLEVTGELVELPRGRVGREALDRRVLPVGAVEDLGRAVEHRGVRRAAVRV